MSSVAPDSSGLPGPGETTRWRGRKLCGAVRVDFVVAPDDDLAAELLQQVREVVRERVVVVDEQHSSSRGLREVESRLERGELAQALLVLRVGAGVGDDARAGLQVRDAVVEHDRADRDAGVEGAVR